MRRLVQKSTAQKSQGNDEQACSNKRGIAEFHGVCFQMRLADRFSIIAS